MRYTDIAIIGGGLAGSTAAAMLGRAGIAAQRTYSRELRLQGQYYFATTSRWRMKTST